MKALSGRSGTSNGVASPATKPERELSVESLLSTMDLSELRDGRSGLGGSDFFASLLESFSSMLKIDTMEGLLGLI